MKTNEHVYNDLPGMINAVTEAWNSQLLSRGEAKKIILSLMGIDKEDLIPEKLVVNQVNPSSSRDVPAEEPAELTRDSCTLLLNYLKSLAAHLNQN